MTYDDETRHIIEPDGLECRLAKDSRKGALPIHLGAKGAQEIARRLDPHGQAMTQEEREALAQTVAEIARKGRYAGVHEPRYYPGEPVWQRVTYLDPSTKPLLFDHDEEAQKIADLLGVDLTAVQALNGPSWASPACALRMLARKALSDILDTEPRREPVNADVLHVISKGTPIQPPTKAD